MFQLGKPLMIVAALSLGACTDAGRFGSGNEAPAQTGSTGSGIIEGSANDPKSPLYFSQAIGDRVLFEVDQHTLTGSAKQVLDGQASWLTTNSDYNAVIEGHADEQGTREHNLALGARRANAVREYLMSRGLPAGRLKTLSYGKERPIAICSEEACYSQNRRAVTVLKSDLSG
ncbi:peptidoglycan-associated lipoprotein Pal [Alisedimentitalea sp. MJ-SS2]|uniref:peptidoglycan-associated lipoprotein Pal n=1 Tax=Aliisedimentitalea sp. MJ-SS2 TaxID=3049795 RepID=UPI00290917E3|nr:peptidoglycan-associated lipoprotein Pal [Alisedimentitalea sp. MJ-SS2]MDU8927298.1 peptidoglycan-associated lipoprotein Pal [Alisedimentitalea sp. MJ-SS2]